MNNTQYRVLPEQPNYKTVGLSEGDKQSLRNSLNSSGVEGRFSASVIISAKFWLNPVSLARNHGFSARELRQIERIVQENRQQLLEGWNEYFGIDG